MTREEAIKILEYPVKKWSMEWDEREDGLSYWEAIDIAISALRAQQEQACNDPLTLEQLRKMDGEPIYIVAGDVSWWDIVSFSSKDFLILTREESMPLKRYGEWLAYRRKPEEGTV